MKVEFRESFGKDLKGVKDKNLLKRTQEIIEAVEKADSLADITNLKKLKGGGNYFRRRVGDYLRAANLVRSLIEARDERTLTRLHGRYQRVELLIIDELGFVPFDRAGGELLFNLLSDRYERRSTMVTTNLAFSEWVQVFAGDEKLTLEWRTFRFVLSDPKSYAT